MTSHCSHVTAGVGNLTGEHFAQLLLNGVCSVCRLRSTSVNLWLCLFPDCYTMCCAESMEDDHSTNHYNTNTDHCLQLNVVNRRVLCYKCCKEVHMSRNEPKVPGVLGVEMVDKRPSLDQDTCSGPPGLVGLSNLGNTCYMNSALQCLSNTPSLSRFFLYCSEKVPKDSKPGLSRAYLQLMEEMWKNDGPRYLAPTDVLLAMQEVCPRFQGFQQHDSQEFLRCFMEQLHRELSEPSEDDDEEESEEKIAAVRDVSIADTFDTFSSGSLISSVAGEGDNYEVEDQFATVDENDDRKRKLTDESEDKDSGLGSVGSFQDADSDKLQDESCINLSDMEHGYVMSDVSSRFASMPHGFASPPCHTSMSTNKRVRNPEKHTIISDIFNGKLESSVQCLSCRRVSVTTEVFQDLSLPIPSPEALQVVRQGAGNSRQKESQDGWFSWAWNEFWGCSSGIDVTLLECLAFFFSAEELKGDNMYSCDLCKKLRNGMKFSKLMELPDTLSIHLKRFGHNFSFTNKINTKVSFPLVDLDMSPWLHTDCRSKQTRYHLTGVICHHGMAGGGHYTSYALNHCDNAWYELDDRLVRPVDLATVAQVEAYVLFYRKSSGEMDLLRGKVWEIAEREIHSPVQFYVSNEWLNKLMTMAEPGPIDNSSVICRHGFVVPHRLGTVQYLCTSVLPAVWQILCHEFGGCVAVNRLQRCNICFAEAEEEERQKMSKLETNNNNSEGMEDRRNLSPSTITCRNCIHVICISFLLVLNKYDY